MDLGTWKMDNLLNLEIWTEDFLKLWNFCFTWETSTGIQNCFGLMVWILIIEWLMWNSFRASNTGKGILQYSGMGRYSELSRGHEEHGDNACLIPNLVHFWTNGQNFGFDTVSGDHISVLKLGVEWNQVAWFLDCFNFSRLGPEFRQNSEHFWQKCPEIGL